MNRRKLSLYFAPPNPNLDPAFSSSNILAGYERHPNIKTAEIEPASDHKVQN